MAWYTPNEGVNNLNVSPSPTRDDDATPSVSVLPNTDATTTPIGSLEYFDSLDATDDIMHQYHRYTMDCIRSGSDASLPKFKEILEKSYNMKRPNEWTNKVEAFKKLKPTEWEVEVRWMNYQNMFGLCWPAMG